MDYALYSKLLLLMTTLILKSFGVLSTLGTMKCKLGLLPLTENGVSRLYHYIAGTEHVEYVFIRSLWHEINWQNFKTAKLCNFLILMIMRILIEH